MDVPVEVLAAMERPNQAEPPVQPYRAGMSCARGILLSVCVCSMASPEGEPQVLVPVLCGSKVHFDCGFLREETRAIRIIWVISAGSLPRKLTTEQLRIAVQVADVARGTPSAEHEREWRNYE